MQASIINMAVVRLVLLAVGLFVTYTALRGIWEAFQNDNFPEALAIKLEILPWVFP